MIKRIALCCLTIGSCLQADTLSKEDLKEDLYDQVVQEDEQADTKAPQVKEDESASEAWGLLSSIDLKDCDPAIIRDADKIKQYVIELCDIIEMKRFGECQVVHFGEDEKVAGYSMVQLIETSLISGHFANLTNAAYIDVFSCKPYDPVIVAEFSQQFFKAKSCTIAALVRE